MVESAEDLGIEDFVRTVLENRFPGETFKHKIRKTSQGIRFHCPYCGDTYTVNGTPRGNLYMKSRRFKCFNGGCFTSVSLNSFISKWASEYNIDTGNIDFNSINLAETENESYNNLLISKDNSICDYLMDMDLYDKMPSIDEVCAIFNLKNINGISKDSNVYKYLSGRCVYSIPDIDKRIYADYADDKVYLMNVDDKNGKVLSYATRTIAEKKYMIHVYTDFFNVWKPKNEIDDSDAEFLNMISSYYNILNVDFNKPVNVTEGQFDAMFLDNYLAIQGVSKSGFIMNHINSDNINLFLDYDEAGIKTTDKMLENNNYGFFLWSDILAKLRDVLPDKISEINKAHDINELFKVIHSSLGDGFTKETFNEIVSKYIRKFEMKRLAFNLTGF